MEVRFCTGAEDKSFHLGFQTFHWIIHLILDLELHVTLDTVHTGTEINTRMLSCVTQWTGCSGGGLSFEKWTWIIALFGTLMSSSVCQLIQDFWKIDPSFQLADILTGVKNQDFYLFFLYY